MRAQLGVRHVQAALLYFCFAVTNSKNSTNSLVMLAIAEAHEREPLYHFTTGTKALIKSSFYFMYVFTAILGAYVSCKFNHKYILLTSNIITTCIHYALPMCVGTAGSWTTFWVVKMIQGTFQGFILPALYGQLAVWFPSDELQYIGPLVFSAEFFSTFFVYTLGSSVAGRGWKSIFHLGGNCGVVWCVAYLCLGAPSPNSCWYISREEKSHIQKKINTNKKKIVGTYRKYIPAKQIVRSIPLYGLVSTQFAHIWSFNAALFHAPLMFANEKKLSFQSSALMVGMPFAISMILSGLITYISQVLLKRGKATIKEIRFCSNSIAQWGLGFWLLRISATVSTTELMAYFALGIIFQTSIILGYRMNHFDLSPSYASFTSGWVNGLAHTAGVIAPVASTHISDGNKEGWRLVYLICASLLFIGNLLYTILGSVKIQPYNAYAEESNEEEEDYNF